MPVGPQPDYGLYLLGHRPPATAWSAAWLRWHDFWLPSDREAAVEAIRGLHRRAAVERVEVACGGGVGRTGTVLAACAVLDGLSPAEAVRFVRERYHRRAVETPWQRAFLRQIS
jgi:protein-tyrosine phosphatase